MLAPTPVFHCEPWAGWFGERAGRGWRVSRPRGWEGPSEKGSVMGDGPHGGLPAFPAEEPSLIRASLMDAENQCGNHDNGFRWFYATLFCRVEKIILVSTSVSILFSWLLVQCLLASSKRNICNSLKCPSETRLAGWGESWL